MQNIENFIKPELLVLIPVLYSIGIGIKKLKSLDRFIPLFLGTIGVVLSILYVFATEDIKTNQDILMASFTSITQGVLTASASVYFNQLYKQAKKDN